MNFLKLFSVLVFVFLVAGKVCAHCEVPCGIYDDQMRIKMLHENVTLIEKANQEIDAAANNYNQVVRWVNAKEDHANQVQDIVSQYFLTQRLKAPADPNDRTAYTKYLKELMMLHEMLVTAMKCKQGTDSQNASRLHQLIEDFSKSYFAQPAKVTSQTQPQKVTKEQVLINVLDGLLGN